MRGLERELYAEKAKTEELLSKVCKECKKMNCSDENIYVAARGNSFQFYCRGEDNAMKYLPANNKDHVADIVKAEYYNKLMKTLERRNKLIESFTKGMRSTEPDHIYDVIGKGKQKLIEPFALTDAQYREEWEKYEYIGKKIDDESGGVYTERGELVRSKSEKIIADKLYKENIAYRYECPVKILYRNVLSGFYYIG